ncbi:exonuclease domain-containing protein [Terrisporobacter petrolearius]|uniref:exonuclease domain-containing protein n=1 Tax=Terrisporobacter petrolearius TaxID=1460447 RepID=UPI003B001974
MEYIVFDLEFNQGFDRKLNKTVSNEKCPFEIIQIGAVKLDSNLEIIDTFNTFVKPHIYREIHPFIKKMTNITNEDVKNAPCFSEAFSMFKSFISNENNILCVWGNGDLKELYRNINYYNLSVDNLSCTYINIQHHASVYFKNPSGKSIGLQNAITLLELNEDKSYHNALNDAYYTSLVFQNIFNDEIETKKYNFDNDDKKKPVTKRKVNYDSIFGEFKKILNRDLNKEEKKIIHLAYKMGRRSKSTKEKNNLKD